MKTWVFLKYKFQTFVTSVLGKLMVQVAVFPIQIHVSLEFSVKTFSDIYNNMLNVQDLIIYLKGFSVLLLKHLSLSRHLLHLYKLSRCVHTYTHKLKMLFTCCDMYGTFRP